DIGDDQRQDHPHEAAELIDGLARSAPGGRELSAGVPHARIPGGVVGERSKGASPWVDFHWRPVGVLAGVPDTPPWTTLAEDAERTTFYAGAASIELYRTETAHYRDNLQTEIPLLWVILRPVEADPPYEIMAVTAGRAASGRLTHT